MTTIATQPSSATDAPRRSHGLFHGIAEFFRQFFVTAFRPYRPELHYMRGPGPACERKNDTIAHRHLI